MRAKKPVTRAAIAGRWSSTWIVAPGCQACVVACHAENNIPTVGPEEVNLGRVRHWIRVERYWDGEYPDLKARFIPIMCQQCQHAPCEPVCPVFATYHSDEENLNIQVYNRCVGTRYCANNCLYVARFFNWFDPYFPEPLNEQLNPDVTVRSRGVMEKCTFCIQRIKRAEDHARLSSGICTMARFSLHACSRARPRRLSSGI